MTRDLKRYVAISLQRGHFGAIRINSTSSEGCSRDTHFGARQRKKLLIIGPIIYGGDKKTVSYGTENIL